MSSEKSYSQILKSTSIMGGAAAIVFLLGMLRTKIAAMLMGSSGVGLIAGFTSIQVLISTIAGLGIQQSGVREIAIAVSKGDDQLIGRTILNLHRTCWLTGLAGLLAMIVISPMVSHITFNSDGYIIDIASLGIVILLVNLTGGQLAVLQGMRRIGDMSRANIGGAILATLISVTFYHWLGLRGIVPSLACSAFIQMLITWYFARTVSSYSVTVTWRETLREVAGIIKLGLAVMWGNLMSATVTYIIIIFITRKIGLDAVGIYNAAFLLSGISVNFVLGAMSADYYPRLTGVAHDNKVLNRLVNEQTEIGLLLALPGLVALLTLAPLMINIFYTPEFLEAVKLMYWFVLGCFGRIITWPLGFLILAIGKGRWFLITETIGNATHLFLVYLGVVLFGIQGVAIAFFISYIVYGTIVLFVTNRLTSFKWSKNCIRIMTKTLAMLVFLCIIMHLSPSAYDVLVGFLITIVVGIVCIKELAGRLGGENRIIKIIRLIPGVNLIINK